MIKIKQLHSECDQTCRAVVFETGWTTVRNWCPRTSVHQAGTRVKTWCLPPLLHKIFFCAREIVVAHSWAKLYVAITGETTLGLSTKRKTQSFFCVAFEESASLAFYIPAFFFFFLYRAWKKFEPRGCVSNGENFRIAHLFFFSSFFFFFRCLEYELHWNGWKIRVNHRCTILLSESDQWENRLLVLQLLLVKLYNCFSLTLIFRHKFQHIYTNNYVL